ncbi:MAG TPA: nucleotidyltransferase domain-containing protein [Armatimonadota bacterium]|jgi:predicted nucleotidyltransferase
MDDQARLTRRYKDALAALLEKLRQDRTVVAVLLGGSLSHDKVWSKSDIDLVVVVQDDAKRTPSYCLVEDGINIHAALMTRRRFRELVEGSLQSSFFNSFVAHGTLVHTTDETLADLFEDIRRVGARDRDLHLLSSGGFLLYLLAKAEKWLTVKHDPCYSFVWALYCVGRIAEIEVVLAGQVPGREVIDQALRCNPELFGKLYVDFIHAPKDEPTLAAALGAINQYLEEKARLLFAPILRYLEEEGGVRSASEMDAYFAKQVQQDSLSFAYEWLADQEILRKVSTGIRLTPRSSATVQEAAYYYDASEER